jgi:hypothetical protein
MAKIDNCELGVSRFHCFLGAVRTLGTSTSTESAQPINSGLPSIAMRGAVDDGFIVMKKYWNTEQYQYRYVQYVHILYIPVHRSGVYTLYIPVSSMIIAKTVDTSPYRYI